MRRHLLLAAIILCATPAAALDLPARKPGLWEIKMTMEGRSLPPQTSQHCIDAETDKMMNSIGGDMRKDACSKQDVQKVGSTIVVDSVCKFGATTTTSHGVVTGDFNSTYTVKINSKREGGPSIKGMPAETNMTVAAKWVGACKADQKPGDMIMANGMKMNVTDMQKGGPGAMPKGAGGPPVMKK